MKIKRKLIMVYNLLNNDFFDNLFLIIMTEVNVININNIGNFSPVLGFALPSFVVSSLMVSFSAILSAFSSEFNDNLNHSYFVFRPHRLYSYHIPLY